MISLSDHRVGAAIAVAEMARAREFYEEVLGLVVDTDSGNNVAYSCADGTIIHVFETPNAGNATATLAGWEVYDIERAVHDLSAQGVIFEHYDAGPIITDASGIATFEGDAKVAYFKDPDGNILSIASPPLPDASGLATGNVATRLPARDLARARAFYAEKLGLEPTETREGGLRYRCGSGSFALFESSGAASGTHTQMAWEVADLTVVVAELRRRGIEFETVDAPGLRTVDGIADIEGNYPSKGRGERAAWFRDSEGNLIGLSQAIR
jgi:catechol 2,3-dioxygenase-like lactoylglutathione lyase family enzyme